MHYISTLEHSGIKLFEILYTWIPFLNVKMQYLASLRKLEPSFFNKFGHKCVKLLDRYIVFYLDVRLVYPITLHLSRPCALFCESFVKSSWCRSALVISTTKPGLFRQIRFQAPFWWYAKNPLNGLTFLYVRRKKCTISPLWNTLESNFSKFCTPEYLFSTCRCSI